MEYAKRLQLKPYRALLEHLDGAWWPRSSNLVDELPGLVTSLSDRLGQVAMVGYHRNGWHEAPPLAEIAGQTIELLGFSSEEPANVILIGKDGRHITLHVIQPDTSEEIARQALEQERAPGDAQVAPLRSPSTARSVADVADKLAQHGGYGDEQRAAQIRRWCDEAAQQFVHAPVQTFVPILVEHIVRNRILESRPRHRRPPATELTA